MRHEAHYWASQLRNQVSWLTSDDVDVDDVAGPHVKDLYLSAAVGFGVGCGVVVDVDVLDAADVDCCCVVVVGDDDDDVGGGVCR